LLFFGLLLIVRGPVPSIAYGLPVAFMHLICQGSEWAALVAVRWHGTIEGPQGWLFMVLSLALVREGAGHHFTPFAS
jgi:hypothetical protein